MKKRSELLFRVLLIPIDYLMIAGGFILAYMVRNEQAKPLAYLISGRSFLRIILPLILIWIIIYAIAGLYNIKAIRSRLVEFTRVVTASALGVMVLIILDFYSLDPFFPSKSIPIYGFVFAVGLVIFARNILYYFQRYLFRFKIGVHNTVIIGRGSSRIQFQKNLNAESRLYRVVENIAFSNNFDIKQLNKINKLHSIDDMFVLEDKVTKEQISRFISFCKSNQIQLNIVPTSVDIYDTSIRMARIKDIPVLEVISTPLEGWSRVIKRLSDLVIVCISFVFTLPLMAIIAILIKLTDPGKVFYLHKRLTRSGKKINIIKFRTMKQDFCTGGKYSNKSDIEILGRFGDPKLVEEFKRTQKLKKDPRVSKIGNFLRKTSLDELPQLFNVLTGNLSLVGPRPIVQQELERYGDESGLFLHIKPGLTGLWQVSGRNDVSYDNRVKLDIYYIENWSIGLDLAILLRTIPIVLRKTGY